MRIPIVLSAMLAGACSGSPEPPCNPGVTLVEQVPVAGLSAVEAPPATPQHVTLWPNPALVDGDLSASAGIDLGFGPTLSGDSMPRDMGFELASAATEVDEVHVWVDRALPQEVSAAYAWSIFRSDDNLAWTPVSSGQAWFDIVEGRFRLLVAPTRARYLKVVTRPLAVGVVTDPAYASVLVTEVRGFTAANACAATP